MFVCQKGSQTGKQLRAIAKEETTLLLLSKS